MCLAVPGRVVSVVDDKVVVDYGFTKRDALVIEESVSVDDFVIVSNGLVTAKVDEIRAKKFLEVLSDD